MTERCVPPEHLRDQPGWWWLQKGKVPAQPWYWLPTEAEWDDGGTPEFMHKSGYVCTAPVTPPAEVAALRAELAALDARPASRATAETVRVAVWKYDDGGYLFTEPGSKEAIWLAQRGNVTRLGTTTLHLDTEAEG